MMGCSIASIIEERYYFKGELDPESMGTLKMTFSNGLEFTFDCDGDALAIKKGGFSDKGNLETALNNEYRWKEKEFLSSEILRQLGETTNILLETVTYDLGTIQSGVKIEFKSGDHLYLWTLESDHFFFGLNETPPYHSKKGLTIELKELKDAVQ